jgi:hypothetical protein
MRACVWIQSAALHLHNPALSDESFRPPSPFGTESIVHLFEPALLQNIDLHEFSEVRNFVQIKANKYKDLNKVKTGSSLQLNWITSSNLTLGSNDRSLTS